VCAPLGVWRNMEPPAAALSAPEALPRHANLPLSQQMVLAYDDEGGIAKMIANKLIRARDGSWVLPFWREMGGPAACRQRPELHGEAGVLLTRDQARSAGSVCLLASSLCRRCARGRAHPVFERCECACINLKLSLCCTHGAAQRQMCASCSTRCGGWLCCALQGHSWGMANVSRSNDSAATWLIEAAVAPAGDGGERLLQARPLPGCAECVACRVRDRVRIKLGMDKALCGSRALSPATRRHAAPVRVTRRARLTACAVWPSWYGRQGWSYCLRRSGRACALRTKSFTQHGCAAGRHRSQLHKHRARQRCATLAGIPDVGGCAVLERVHRRRRAAVVACGADEVTKPQQQGAAAAVGRRVSGPERQWAREGSGRAVALG